MADKILIKPRISYDLQTIESCLVESDKLKNTLKTILIMVEAETAVYENYQNFKVDGFTVESEKGSFYYPTGWVMAETVKQGMNDEQRHTNARNNHDRSDTESLNCLLR